MEAVLTVIHFSQYENIRQRRWLAKETCNPAYAAVVVNSPKSRPSTVTCPSGPTIFQKNGMFDGGDQHH